VGVRPKARACDGLDRTLGRARARVGRTPACRPGSNTCTRVVIHPSLLSPWSVHKTSSPLYKLPILCGGHRILPTGFKDLEP
jgi:hypothetical protein